MTPEAAQRREHWFARQPDWVREVYYTHGSIHSLLEVMLEPPAYSDEFIWRTVARGLLMQVDCDAKTIARLMAIAPKRIKGPDGAEWVYRCPDHLIPLDETAVTPPPVFPK